MRRGLPLALALALAAATFDPLTPQALAKGGAVFAVALVGAVLALRAGSVDDLLIRFTALAGWLAASLLWSAHPEPVALTPWLTLPLLLQAASPQTAVQRRDMACTFAVVTLALTGAIAVAQHLGHRAVDGGHGNPNALGLVVVVCLPLALDTAALRWRAARSAGLTRGVQRALVMALAACAGFALVVSQSRTAWLALGVAAMVFSQGKWRILSIPLFVGLGAAALRGDLVRAGAGRVHLAQVGLRAALDAAPLGGGLGAFPFAYLEAQSGVLAGETPVAAARLFLHAVTPHGDWLGLLVVGGVLGMGLALACAWGAAARTRGRPAEAATLLVVAIAALGDDALVLPAVTVCVALTVSACRADEACHSGGIGSVPRRAIPWLLVGASALFLPVVVRRYASQRCIHLAERVETDTEAHQMWLARARRIDPTDGEAALVSGLAFLAEGDSTQALVELHASDVRLANVGTKIAIGNAELGLDRPLLAVAAYREAARLDPGSFRAHANLVYAYTTMRAFDAAEAELSVARSLQPHHPKLARMADGLMRSRMDAALAGDEPLP